MGEKYHFIIFTDFEHKINTITGYTSIMAEERKKIPLPGSE